MFEVRSTGQIYPLVYLDRENKDIYNFTVKVSSCDIDIDIPVQVDVTDENDNVPNLACQHL